MKNTVKIFVQGGIVQGVFSNADVEVSVVDLDTQDEVNRDAALWEWERAEHAVENGLLSKVY